MAAVEAPFTRIRIEASDRTAQALADLGGRLRSAIPVLQQAGDVYVQQMETPNGTQWEGDTATSFPTIAHIDRSMCVSPMINQADELAGISERGSEYVLGARETALHAIMQAENEDFTVGADLSVTDNSPRESAAGQAVRQEAAAAHRSYIAHCAARLEAETTRIAGRLNAGAAEMAAMTPAHWRQPFTESVPTSVPRTSPTAQRAASATAKAVDRSPSVAPANGKASNQRTQSLGMGGLKEAPGVDALSVRNARDVHKIVDPLPPGKNPGVKTLPTPEAIRGLYEQLTEDSLPAPPSTYSGEERVLGDGTRIGYRPNSKWGGPTVDIKYPDGTTASVHLPEPPKTPQPEPAPAPAPAPAPVTAPAPADPGTAPIHLPPLRAPTPEQRSWLESVGAAIVGGLAVLGELGEGLK